MTCWNLQDGYEQWDRILLTPFCPTKWTIIVSQALSAKGVACEICERSGLWGASHWPQNGLRGNLLASKFQNFSACLWTWPPQTWRLRALANWTFAYSCFVHIIVAFITYYLQPLQSRGRGWGRWMLADCHVGSRAQSSPRWEPCGYWHAYGPRRSSEEVPRAGSPPQHSGEG